MNKSLICALLLAAPGSLLAQVTPAWPAKLFAPYAYIPYDDAASACLAETGQKFFTLAFVISDPEGRPAWDGQKDRQVKGGFYADAIGAIRARGGDVIVSFGGEGGKELALTTPDAASLAAKYQGVVDRYHLTWLDFDIEGKTLADPPANQRRNAALQTLRAARPGLRYTFTLPGDPTGLEDDALQLLADAKAQGVVIESVNVMTMDYKREVSRGAKMGDLAIQAARAVRAQVLNLGMDVKIGVTPMIGENDVKSVVFGPADAAGLLTFAQQTPWVRSVSFWSVNRDGPGTSGDDTNSGTAQPKWEYTNAFKALSERTGLIAPSLGYNEGSQRCAAEPAKTSTGKAIGGRLALKMNARRTSEPKRGTSMTFSSSGTTPSRLDGISCTLGSLERMTAIREIIVSSPGSRRCFNSLATNRTAAVQSLSDHSEEMTTSYRSTSSLSAKAKR